MNSIKLSNIQKILEHKDNKFLEIDGINTKDIKIEKDLDYAEIQYNLVYIIASIISNNDEFLDLMNIENLSVRNMEQIEALKVFLKSSKNGVMEVESIRKDLLQFEIVTKMEKYQVEIHLGNQNFCICKDFNIVSIDAYK